MSIENEAEKSPSRWHHEKLADELIAWVDAYANKVCPEGCLPTMGQEREIKMFADITRALRFQDTNSTLADFVAYCEAHPTDRFWQALRNWSGQNFILIADIKPSIPDVEDTFYWEGRTRQ